MIRAGGVGQGPGAKGVGVRTLQDVGAGREKPSSVSVIDKATGGGQGWQMAKQVTRLWSRSAGFGSGTVLFRNSSWMCVSL